MTFFVLRAAATAGLVAILTSIAWAQTPASSERSLPLADDVSSHGERWLIVNILWEAERPDNIIPDKYLFE